jgi:hypothetical protein
MKRQAHGIRRRELPIEEFDSSRRYSSLVGRRAALLPSGYGVAECSIPEGDVGVIICATQ